MAIGSAFDAVLASGIIIASDTAEYNRIGVYNPTDATTNPSLVYAAVSSPEYAHILDEAVRYANSRRSSGSIDDRTALAMDRALVQVGAHILAIVSGRVSVSVDPRLADDADAIVHQGRNLIALFEELNIPRERVLIKIPATYQGILAARTLQFPAPLHRPISTNLTLVFGRVQALACAQAGVSVISPFIGRVKDWWAAHAPLKVSPALAQHPGILLVHQIRSAYTAYGHKTQIMAAGFRSADEIIELGRLGAEWGPDLVTLPPNLLDDLKHREGFAGHDRAPTLSPGPEPIYFSSGPSTADDGAAFATDLAKERIAVDKVPEGLAKFAADVVVLEGIIRERVKSTA